MADHLERLLNVVGYEIGTPGAGERPTLGVRFQLPDGSKMAFALTAELATSLAVDLMRRLEPLREREPPKSH